MKVLYFSCFAGISGDMTLGALVDLGVSQEYLIGELNKLPMASEFELKIGKAQKMGITGTKVDVVVKDHGHEHAEGHDHSHDHGNEHSEGHDHGHDHGHEHSEGHDHSHDHGHEHHEGHDHKHDHDHPHHEAHLHHDRDYASIKAMIDHSPLSDKVKYISNKIFLEVARAEAKIHNKTLEDVHFHEVGAVDSIVDIIGTAICIDYLNVDKIMASTIELGGGFVKCTHGLLPVPAPATAEILKDVPVHLGRVNSETTTPTGAAIIKALVEEFTDDFGLKLLKTAYGLGTKDFKIPNMLRVYLADMDQISEKQIMVETNIDDMNPEIFSYVEEQLFEAGARDVFKTSIMMKKGRPAVLLSVLVERKNLGAIEQILFKETTTLGLRQYEVEKKALERQFRKINTLYGEVTIKMGLLEGRMIQIKPEYEECKTIALREGLPLKKVYADIQRAIDKEII